MAGTESLKSRAALLRHGPAVICAGFALWVVVAWASYDRKFAQAKQGWDPGGKYLVELTLTSQDRESPACAADAGPENLRCGFGADRKRVDGVEEDRLRPYKSVDGGAFLAAGLWRSPSLAEPIMARRSPRKSRAWRTFVANMCNTSSRNSPPSYSFRGVTRIPSCQISVAPGL